MAHEPTDRVTFDAATLTDDQRDGVACVVCSSIVIVMRPVGILDGGQLFACASHNADQVRRAGARVAGDPTGCPSWCRADHTRDGRAHRVEVGRADVGTAMSGERIPVVVVQVPGGQATITVSGGLYVAVQPDDAEDMARLLDMADEGAMADLIRRAAGVLQDDDDDGDVVTPDEDEQTAETILYLAGRGPAVRRLADELRADGHPDVADTVIAVADAHDRLRVALDENGDVLAAMEAVYVTSVRGKEAIQAARAAAADTPPVVTIGDEKCGPAGGYLIPAPADPVLRAEWEAGVAVREAAGLSGLVGEDYPTDVAGRE